MDRASIVAVSLDLMPSSDFSTGSTWATFIRVLQSEVSYWMPLEPINLTQLEPGEWQRITVPIQKAEFEPAMKAFFSIITVINSGANVSGTLYIDNLGFKVRTAK